MEFSLYSSTKTWLDISHVYGLPKSKFFHQNLLGKKVKFIWTDNCQKSFEKLKAILKSAPVFLAPSFDKEFKLAVDVSDVGAESVLLQEADNGVDHPVCYCS